MPTPTEENTSAPKGAPIVASSLAEIGDALLELIAQLRLTAEQSPHPSSFEQMPSVYGE